MNTKDSAQRQAFIDAYMVCALWSSSDTVDGEDVELDTFRVDQIHPDTATKMRHDCEAFMDRCEKDLAEWEAAQAGHDFWLTRNGHGAGYFDRGIESGDRLTIACAAFGGVDLYVGDDGLIYS